MGSRLDAITIIQEIAEIAIDLKRLLQYLSEPTNKNIIQNFISLEVQIF